MPAERAPGLYEVATGSMRPVLCEGDFVLVEPPPARWRVGDVLLLPPLGSRPEKVVHRLVAVRPEHGRLRLITRGDANAEQDEPLPAEAALGRVCLVGRRDGGGPDLSGWRLEAARALGPAVSGLVLSGRLGRAASALALLYERLPWRFARRRLVAASIALDAVRRSALRENLARMAARAAREG